MVAVGVYWVGLVGQGVSMVLVVGVIVVDGMVVAIVLVQAAGRGVGTAAMAMAGAGAGALAQDMAAVVLVMAAEVTTEKGSMESMVGA